MSPLILYIVHRPTTDYQMVFVPELENGSRPYIPRAKPFPENKSLAGSMQKHGDLARYTMRQADFLRNEAQENERVLYAFSSMHVHWSICCCRPDLDEKLVLQHWEHSLKMQLNFECSHKVTNDGSY